ncbi:MAG: tetratricopeptide repeat protein [Promethearchaeota archaeon]
MELQKKYEFLKIFFGEYFNINEYSHSHLANLPIERVHRKNRQIIQNNISWMSIFSKIESDSKILDNFLENYDKWIQMYKKFLSIDKKEEIFDFLNEYGYSELALSYQDGNKNKEEIKEFLLNKKPRIFFLPNSDFFNLKIVESDGLHIYAHIKLTITTLNIYKVLLLITIFLESPSYNFDIDMNFIHSFYLNLISCHELILKLKNKEYLEIAPFDYEKELSILKHYPNQLLEWVQSKPFFLKNFYIEMLHQDPFKIIENTLNEIKEFEILLINCKNSSIKSPLEWYSNLENKIKDFIKNGQELFLKTRMLTDFSVKKDDESKITSKLKPKVKKDEKLLQKIYHLFKKIRENDENNPKINVNDKGYRTLHKFFEEFKDQLGISKQTLYTLFKNYKDQIRNKFEIRDRKEKGGGKEYRYRKLEIYNKSYKLLKSEGPIEQENQFYLEKMKIEQGYSYYKDKRYDEVKRIFKKIITNPSESLKSKIILYNQCIFLLGKSYFHSGKYDKALKYLEMIRATYIDVNYLKAKIFVKKYEINRALKLLKKIIIDINKIIEKFPSDELIKGENNDFLELYEKNFLFGQIFSLENKYEKMGAEFSIVMRNAQLKQNINYNIENLSKMEKLNFLKEKFCYLLVEMYRRLLLKAVLEKNFDDFLDLFEEMTTSIKKISSKGNTLEPFIYFLFYGKNIINALAPEKTYIIKRIESKIKELYPYYNLEYNLDYDPLYRDINNRLIKSNIYREISEFLKTINSILKSNGLYYNEPQLDLKDNFLKLEYYLILAYYQNRRLQAEIKRINDIIEKLSELSEKNYDTITFIRKYLNFYNFMEDTSERYKKPINEAMESCTHNNIPYLLKWAKDIQEDIDKKEKMLLTLKMKGKRIIINRIFNKLHSQVFFLNTPKLLNIPKESAEKDYDVLIDEIFNKILDGFNENQFSYVIKSEDQKLMKIIYEWIHFQSFSLSLPKDTFYYGDLSLKSMISVKSNAIHLSFIPIVDIPKNLTDVHSITYNFLSLIAYCISRKIPALLVKGSTNLRKTEKFLMFLERNFNKTITNNYFYLEFQFQINQQEILIKIIRKE